LNNLAQHKPELVKELAKKWEEWALRVHATPYPVEQKGRKAADANSGGSPSLD